MSPIVHLIRKEARDVRWHVRGGLLALVALTFLFAWLASDNDAETYRSVIGAGVFWAIPSGALLAGAAVAAEVFAGECASRRVDATALLPVPLSQVFRAKCAMTAIAWVLGGVVMAVAAPLAALAFDPGNVADVVAGAVANGALVGLGTLPVVASIAVFACILEHGLGSVLAGLFSLALLTGLVGWLGAWEDWGIRPENGFVLAAGAPVTAALVWGAWLAFTRGPIHLGMRLRRFALGAGAGFGSLAITGVAGAAVLDARVDLEPGDPDAHAWSLRTSPDGAFAVVFVENTRTDSTTQAWSVRIADGTAVRLPGRHIYFENWGAPGTVRVSGADGASRGEAVEIDLATGAVLPSIDAGESSDPSWPARAWNDRWARITTKDRTLTIEWRERGLSRTVADAWNVVVSPVPGRALVGGRGLVVDLVSGKDMEIGGESGIQWGTHRWVDGGRALTYYANGKRRLFDCESWEEREIAPPSGSGFAEFGDGPFASFARVVRDEAAATGGAGGSGGAAGAGANASRSGRSGTESSATASEVSAGAAGGSSGGTAAVPNPSPAKKLRVMTGIFDLRTGCEVKREGGDGWLWFVPGSGHWATTESATGDRCLVDCRTGRQTAPIPQLSWNLGWNRVQELPDGRLLVVDGSAWVWLVAPDGAVVRRVFPGDGPQ